VVRVLRHEDLLVKYEVARIMCVKYAVIRSSAKALSGSRDASCGTRSDSWHIYLLAISTRKVIDSLIMTPKALPDKKADI
jgi:hypothetical protein